MEEFWSEVPLKVKVIFPFGNTVLEEVQKGKKKLKDEHENRNIEINQSLNW